MKAAFETLHMHEKMTALARTTPTKRFKPLNETSVTGKNVAVLLTLFTK